MWRRPLSVPELPDCGSDEVEEDGDWEEHGGSGIAELVEIAYEDGAHNNADQGGKPLRFTMRRGGKQSG